MCKRSMQQLPACSSHGRLDSSEREERKSDWRNDSPRAERVNKGERTQRQMLRSFVLLSLTSTSRSPPIASLDLSLSLPCFARFSVRLLSPGSIAIVFCHSDAMSFVRACQNRRNQRIRNGSLTSTSRSPPIQALTKVVVEMRGVCVRSNITV